MVHSYWVPIVAFISTITAVPLDISSIGSITSAARAIAQNIIENNSSLNAPGRPVGLFSDDYYWWVSGAVWGGMIDYQNYTGDTQYNEIIAEALIAQQGLDADFFVRNQTKTEANDDQAVWGLAAMTAAEHDFPRSSQASRNASWIDLAMNVFDRQVARWDAETCGGGLRWQIFTFNNGYDYKNSATNGIFFQLAARLARYTGNQTYAEWATRAYEWSTSVGLITEDYNVYDGVSTSQNCSRPVKLQWSYMAATFLYGSAIMNNITTGPSPWRNRTQGHLSAITDVFFPPSNIMVETACEPPKTCNSEQPIYKGIAAQWMGATARVAPFTHDAIATRLQASARGAAASCTGGSNNTDCGLQWTRGYDGNIGLGQELSALNVLVANLAMNATSPSVTANSTSGNVSVAPASPSASSGAGEGNPADTPGSSVASFAGPFSTSMLACAGTLAVFVAVVL